jgi:hypothetical protein
MPDSSLDRQLTDVREQVDENLARLREMQQVDVRERYEDRQRNIAVLAADQAAVDHALELWGRQAPSPQVYETRGEYQRRCARQHLVPFLPPGAELKGVPFSRATEEAGALRVLWPRLLREVRDAVWNPDTVPHGQFREVKQKEGGRERSEFVGPDHFIKEMKAPSREVVAFGDDRVSSMMWPMRRFHR